jgi:thymidine kinase
MAKLYFRHGAMSSAKTLNLLAAAHSYEMQAKKVKVMKPQLDVRFGEGTIQSRAGLDRKADQLLHVNSTFPEDSLQGISCILVDEAQFLHPCVVERLRDVATYQNIPVICYGLRTDFRSRLFPGSQRLLELADTIEEVKTTCSLCNKKATMNMKSVEGTATMDGPTVCLGADEMYAPTCYFHFCERISTAAGRPVDFRAAWAAGEEADMAQRSHIEEQAERSFGREPEVECTPMKRPPRLQEPESEKSPLKA